MNQNRKKAPGRLSRAIVALAASTGKKLPRRNNRAPEVAGVRELNCPPEGFDGDVRQSERTTITVETERMPIV
jgi:hypothetical protein